MTDRAHLYRVITDNQGNVNLDALTVSVFQPGTSTLIADTLYSDNSSGVSPGNPFAISNGIVDLYLATPQRVDLKIDDGSRVTIYHDLDVLEVVSGGGSSPVVVDGNNNLLTPGLGATVPNNPSDSVVLGVDAVDHGTVGSSVIIGDSASAGTGTYSAVVLGYTAMVSNGAQEGAVAIGSGAEVHAHYGTAVGSIAVADDFETNAFGEDASAYGTQSSAIGSNSSATADSGVALGNNSIAGAGWQASFKNTKINATALGDGAWAKGNNTTAVGANSGAYADLSTALGENSFVNTSHTQSTAVGAQAVTTAAHQIMLGTAAETVVVPGTLAFGQPDMIDFQKAHTMGPATTFSVGSQTQEEILFDSPSVLNTVGSSLIIDPTTHELTMTVTGRYVLSIELAVSGDSTVDWGLILGVSFHNGGFLDSGWHGGQQSARAIPQPDWQGPPIAIAHMAATVYAGANAYIQVFATVNGTANGTTPLVNATISAIRLA